MLGIMAGAANYSCNFGYLRWRCRCHTGGHGGRNPDQTVTLSHFLNDSGTLQGQSSLAHTQKKTPPDCSGGVFGHGLAFLDIIDDTNDVMREVFRHGERSFKFCQQVLPGSLNNSQSLLCVIEVRSDIKHESRMLCLLPLVSPASFSALAATDALTHRRPPRRTLRHGIPA